ncbi:hypothetical protein ABMA27_008397 [Loxostege sticticalis]|uniref:Uncharacterized protein n=1 Tax=Loxostege sticticalis TaxID=481309 RepID=A0ABR3HBK9_LOXSC
MFYTYQTDSSVSVCFDHFICMSGVGRRRGGGQLRSAVGRRRARSQALRREKLNSQSLRSHMQHTKQAYDYSSEAVH